MPDVTLEPAELAVLLSLLDARSIPGAETDVLIPEDGQERQAQLDQGVVALQQHGHFKVVAGRFDGLATPLLLAVAVLAAPAQAILTTRYLAEGEQRLAHYIADDLVVEFYRTAARNYRLVTLRSVETAIARIGAMLALDASAPDSPMTLSMPEPVLERLLLLARGGSGARHDLAALLNRAGANRSRARRLVQALADPQPAADVDLARARNGELSVQHSVRLFTAASQVGMLQFSKLGRSALTVPAGPAFGNALLESWRALKEAGQPGRVN